MHVVMRHAPGVHQKPCLGRGQICPRSAESMSTSSDIDKDAVARGNANVTLYKGPGPLQGRVEYFGARLSTTNFVFSQLFCHEWHRMSESRMAWISKSALQFMNTIDTHWTLENRLYTAHPPLLLSPIIHCQSPMGYRVPATAQRINSSDEFPRRSSVDKQLDPKCQPPRPSMSRHTSASKVPVVLEVRPEPVVNQVRNRSFTRSALSFIYFLIMCSIGKVRHRHGYISADIGSGRWRGSWVLARTCWRLFRPSQNYLRRHEEGLVRFLFKAPLPIYLVTYFWCGLSAQTRTWRNSHRLDTFSKALQRHLE